MRKTLTCVCGVAALIVQICAEPPARADEALSRKPGLWEVKASIENSNAPARTVRQCIDAATDQMLQSSAGPISPAACAQHSVQRAADQIVQDFSCVVAGAPATAHSVVNGSLDSAYTMTVTAQGGAVPDGKMTMTMEGKWLGPCTADLKPGDIIVNNGIKINIPDIQKRATSAVDPMAAH